MRAVTSFDMQPSLAERAEQQAETDLAEEEQLISHSLATYTPLWLCAPVGLLQNRFRVSGKIGKKRPPPENIGKKSRKIGKWPQNLILEPLFQFFSYFVQFSGAGPFPIFLLFFLL